MATFSTIGVAEQLSYGPPEGLLIKLDELTDPSYTALLVIDMQNDFIKTKDTPGYAILPIVNKLIVEARKSGVVVFYATVVHSIDLDAPVYMARYAKRGFDPDSGKPLLCQENTWGAQLHDELEAPLTNERIVVKYGYDSFQDTHLEDWLKNKGIRSIIYTGVNTDWCVLASLISGFHRNYYVVVPADAVATSSGENAQKVTLDLIRDAYGSVVTSDEIIELWKKKRI